MKRGRIVGGLAEDILIIVLVVINSQMVVVTKVLITFTREIDLDSLAKSFFFGWREFRQERT